MKRTWLWFPVVIILFGAVVGAGAAESVLDPLLELLVEQGVITMEQALAVQAEYDRRGTEGGTAVPPAAVAQQEAPSPATVAPAPEVANTAVVTSVPPGLKDLSIGTLVYLSYQNGNDAAGVDYNQFQIKRGYIDIRKKITPNFSARITPDVHQDETGDLNVRLKYAYGKFNWKGRLHREALAGVGRRRTCPGSTSRSTSTASACRTRCSWSATGPSTRPISG